MVKKLNPIVVAQKLREHNLIIFSPRELQRLFSVSNFAVSKFLHQYTKKNFFVKLRNGLYCFSDNQPNSFVLANKIYVPSYLSLETALSFYGLIPESAYEITSVSTRATRTFKAAGKIFSYAKIKKNLFCGYTTAQLGEEKFLIAEPEKALFDYLYLVSLQKRNLNTRLNVSGLKKDKIAYWQKFFNHPSINKLIAEIYAH